VCLRDARNGFSPWSKGGSSDMTHAIEVSNLTKAYGNVVAVDRLTFSVPKGTFFGFLGANGAGKSTTIGCLTGLLEPSGGVVRLLGEPFDADSVALKARIGIVPENLGLFEFLYAHEFLEFQGQMYGLDQATARRRTTELLEALGLDAERGKTLGAFSAGMRKRVAFAGAVIHVPDILFLDEPFESIDPAGVALMKQWLRRLTDQGRTVFLTTHVLDVAERLCDRVVIIRQRAEVVWDGDVTPLASGRPIVVEGREFRRLEELFLHKTGTTSTEIEWL